MAQTSIHDVKANEFKAMTPRERVNFLSDVFVTWIPATGPVSVEDEISLPESYVPMFDRRVRQHAVLNGADRKDEAARDKAMQEVLNAAVAKRDALLASGELVLVSA